MHPAAPPSATNAVDPLRRWFKSARRAVLWLAMAAALAGRTQPVPPSHPAESSDNIFQASPVLPVEVRRVAVLPPTREDNQAGLSAGGEMLAPLLVTELLKTRRFEVVVVSPEDLRSLTGRLSWTDTDILLADFFGSLQRVYGCDAVLFCHLTAFRAYAPLAVGWRMKLVNARTRQIVWAVDEVFDAEKPGVLSQARLFHAIGPWVFHDSANDWRVENSPRQFGQYALSKSLSSLPIRKDMIKVSPPTADEPSRRWSDKKPVAAKKAYGN